MSKLHTKPPASCHAGTSLEGAHDPDESDSVVGLGCPDRWLRDSLRTITQSELNLTLLLGSFVGAIILLAIVKLVRCVSVRSY